MGISWVCRAVLLYLVPFLNLFHISVIAMPGSFLTVKSSTSWTNSLSAPHSVKFDDGSFVTIILTHGSPDPYGYACGCGFLYNRTYNSSLFVIFSLYYEDGNTTGSYHPETVWSANPKNPVSLDATLQLTSEGGLVLEDANGTKAWSTNISNKSVVGLNLTEDTCNLMLLDDKNATIWQSFDHPTDTLVLGQKLLRGQQLTSEGGMFSFSITSEGLFFYINSNPPDIYLNLLFSSNFKYNYSQFWNHSFAIFELDDPLPHIPFKFEPNSKYMKLRPDGHLKVYDEYWIEALDFLKRRIGFCGYPTKETANEAEENYLNHVPGMPTRKKIEEERLLDLVDKNSGDMQLHGKDVVNMMMVAAWCLQIDFTKRPSMSTVVKVLEGVVDVESNLDYCFSNPPLPNTRARVDNQDGHIVATTLVLPSVLSGPR
nr:epidermis-specific secreted glycoprotein ep1 [Quercus suber]